MIERKLENLCFYIQEGEGEEGECYIGAVCPFCGKSNLLDEEYTSPLDKIDTCEHFVGITFDKVIFEKEV